VTRILTIASRKGGAGKSTIARAFAVEAAQAGASVELIDMDPQGTVRDWFGRRRGEPPQVTTAEPSTIGRAIKDARAAGRDYVFIDTPPHTDGAMTEAARLSDAVLIPVKPYPDDLVAARATIDIVRTMRRPAVLIINAAPPRAAASGLARSSLARFGLPVVPHDITDRIAHAYASSEGRTAAEYEPGGKAAAEVAAAWAYITAALFS